MTTTTPITIGDRVHWTHSQTKGSRIHLSTKQGRVTDITGRLAWVKLRNGHEMFVAVASLRHADQKTDLTEFFEGLATAIVDGEVKVGS